MTKNILVLVTLGVCLSNCGGGGGGGGNDKVDTCQTYCDYACQKVQNCHPNNPFDVEACGSGCFDKTDGNQDRCQQAAVGVAGLTCIQLDTLLGFRSAELRSSTDIDAYEVGSEIATKAE